MEGNLRWALVTAIAPVAWGSTYFVTREFLPADAPLWGAVLRALPAGIMLLLLRRRMPRGAWWWRSLVLGVLNVGAFFVLVYLAAQLLPSSIASTVMATSPVAMMLLAWLLIAERPRLLSLVAAGVGIAGVALLLLTSAEGIRWDGVLASVAALAMSSVGYILAKRWNGPSIDLIASTSWQLVAGGLVLVPIAVAVEGGPPVLDTPALLGFGYVSFVATAVAFVAWFSGLRKLPAGTVGIIGLLNPVAGVLLGVLVAGETLVGQQIGGLGLVLMGVLLGQPAVQERMRGLGGQGLGARPAAPGATRPAGVAPGAARAAEKGYGVGTGVGSGTVVGSGVGVGAGAGSSGAGSSSTGAGAVGSGAGSSSAGASSS